MVLSLVCLNVNQAEYHHLRRLVPGLYMGKGILERVANPIA